MVHEFSSLVTPSFRPSHSESLPLTGEARTEIRRPPLHPLEIALIVITGLHLCFLPWALGAMHPWSQLTSLALAMLGMFLATLPRNEGADFSDAPRTRLWPARRLFEYPSFWLGLLFLGYITIQGLNPAWRFVSNDDAWWLEPAAHLAWLPSSVAAPFARANSWRALIIFSSLTLLVSSVWVGFSRRKSYHALFTLLAVNAGLLALFGLVQHLSGAKRIYWSYVASNDGFVASFIYPNHAGPYLYLMTALALALARWHDQRARKRMEESGPSTVFLFLAACCSLMVIFSFSRLSIMLLFVFILTLGGVLAYQLFHRTGPIRDRPEFWPLALTVVAFLGLGLVTLSTDKARDRFAEMLENSGEVTARALARQAASDMFHDYWLTGWGAGCFRYGFPKYTERYPEIHYLEGGGRRTWEHAHNDLIEFPVELGVVGLLPLIGIFGCGAWQFCRRRFWGNVVSLSLMLGCGLVLLHSWVDFVFQNPAILLTWSVLLAGALRWAELDQPRRRQVATNSSPLRE